MHLGSVIGTDKGVVARQVVVKPGRWRWRWRWFWFCSEEGGRGTVEWYLKVGFDRVNAWGECGLVYFGLGIGLDQGCG